MSTSSFKLNAHMLVSDARYLHPKGINAHEHTHDQPNLDLGRVEHSAAIGAFKKAGIQITQVPSPQDCQDGVFTANWGLTWNGRALLANLPEQRRVEEPYAEEVLKKLGFETKRSSTLFSGQGSAMIIGGNRVLVGDGYRNDPRVVSEIRDWLGLEPILVRAKPKRHWYGLPVRNRLTGLEDSYFYDVDIAIGVLRPDLLAICWDALTPEGRRAIQGLKDVGIIPVDYHEAKNGLACNLVSFEDTVVVANSAPRFIDALRHKGFNVLALPNIEIKKSGGGFRCSSLSLYM